MNKKLSGGGGEEEEEEEEEEEGEDVVMEEVVQSSAPDDMNDSKKLEVPKRPVCHQPCATRVLPRYGGNQSQSDAIILDATVGPSQTGTGASKGQQQQWVRVRNKEEAKILKALKMHPHFCFATRLFSLSLLLDRGL